MRQIIHLAAGLGLGVALSQAPEFAQQYEQRLGGAVDELAAIIADFDATAEKTGLSRQQALGRYAVNTDPFIVARGSDVAAVVARYENLSAHLVALQNASNGERPFILMQHYDARIAEAVWQSYVPAVPVSLEGFAYAGLGLLGGYGAGAVATSPFRRKKRRYA